MNGALKYLAALIVSVTPSRKVLRSGRHLCAVVLVGTTSMSQNSNENQKTSSAAEVKAGPSILKASTLGATQSVGMEKVSDTGSCISLDADELNKMDFSGEEDPVLSDLEPQEETDEQKLNDPIFVKRYRLPGGASKTLKARLKNGEDYETVKRELVAKHVEFRKTLQLETPNPGDKRVREKKTTPPHSKPEEESQAKRLV